MSSSILSAASEWASLDPNPLTKAAVESLVSSSDEATLTKAFSSRIAFGTAGLRSAMSYGPANMNDLVIIQTCQGLSSYIKSLPGSGSDLTAVVGYDHRSNPELNLSSLKFAQITKAVFEANGIPTLLLHEYVPTPLVPFAVSSMKACCGIMVTASHNPAQDDGYKVYWSDGSQIVPPHDKNIAAAIDANLVPAQAYDLEGMGAGDKERTEGLLDEYYAAIKAKLVTSNYNADANTPVFAYTAMHGIGGKFAKRSFEIFGQKEFLAVPCQYEPDHTFPTVSFPNPEEKGALDKAMEFAVENSCDVVLANDPDADRLAVAEKDRGTGAWTVFKGDQIGVLLGTWMWECFGKKCEDPKSVVMLASAVSSKMLKTVAETEGFTFEETLTGFKWLGNRNLQLAAEGKQVIFSYEEAIGFCCGDVVVDKDGVSAAGVFAEMACDVYAKGGSVAGKLQSLYEKYGEFVSNNGYYFCYDSNILAGIFDKMRNGGKYFEEVGGYKVVGIRDLGVPGYDSAREDKQPVLPLSASSPMVSITFENGTVAQFRGSGTEPKFKYYIEMAGKPGVSRAQVEKDLKDMCDVILEELLAPEQNGLVKP
jgi:phosphomannomutase